MDGVWSAFDGRPHRLRMGLHPLAPEAWTISLPPPDLIAELDRKHALLESRRDEVLATADDDDGQRASAELLERLVDHLVLHHHDRYHRSGATLALTDNGRTWDLTAGDPLDLAGRLVAEDWCLVRPGSPPTLAGATLCSPNRWRLREKLHRPVADIHDPVPGYRRRLAAPVDASLAASRGPAWRRNWSIQSSPLLFQPVPDGPAHPRIPEEVWVRSEYETLVRLPSSGWWVFGIRTEVRPLAELGDRPGTAARVLAAVSTLDPATAAYKDVAGWLDPLVAWLTTASQADLSRTD